MTPATNLSDNLAQCCRCPGSWSARCLALVLLATTVLQSLTSQSTAAVGTASAGVDAFKRLLDSPPVIEQLIYREKLPPTASAMIPMDVGVTHSTNYALYELRWQSNAMSVRSLESNVPAGKADAYRATFTVWNDNFWFLDNSTNVFVYHMEHESVRSGHVPPSYDAAWYRISRFSEVMNLGISHIKPGSVRWIGDRFSAQGLADKQPMSVTGRISRLTNGVPCELDVRYSNTMAVVDYRLSYEYASSAPSGYPKRVSLVVKHGSKETEYRSYELISVKAGNRPMPETHFDPDHLRDNRSIQLRLLTNDSIFLRLPTGKLLESRASLPNAKLTQAEYYRNRYFYLSMSLVTLVFFRAFIRKSSINSLKKTV
jgi:hypothetical protein